MVTRKCRSYHTYTDTFNGAVRGPTDEFPSINGDYFQYTPDDLFNDPSIAGFECCEKATVTLRLRGRVLKRRTLDQWRAQRSLSAYLHTPGWYTLSVSAWRWSTLVPVPPGILSPRASIAWRFYDRPGPERGNWRDFPVTLTVYRPWGLDLSNEAAQHGRTKVELHVVRAGNSTKPAPRYRLKTIRVQASFNDGKTWQALRASKACGHWLVSVPDPASGTVALRSTVIDVKGDSTMQTIYRAYGIR